MILLWDQLLYLFIYLLPQELGKGRRIKKLGEEKKVELVQFIVNNHNVAENTIKMSNIGWRKYVFFRGWMFLLH